MIGRNQRTHWTLYGAKGTRDARQKNAEGKVPAVDTELYCV